MENVLIMKDYYAILQVNRNASIDDIKKQYKILARKFHPDKGGDENKFKEISEAFQILSDPQKKLIMIILFKPVLLLLHMIFSLKLL